MAITSSEKSLHTTSEKKILKATCILHEGLSKKDLQMKCSYPIKSPVCANSTVCYQARYTLSHIGTYRNTSVYIGTDWYPLVHIGTYWHILAHIGTHVV